MRDIKESYEEAIELVADALTPSALEDVLFADLHKDLPFYPLFENALQEASDNENINEQLIAMDREIAQEITSRLDAKYGIFDRKYVRDLEKLVATKI